jgi:hypothetical protein
MAMQSGASQWRIKAPTFGDGQNRCHRHSAAAARELARIDGQRRALGLVVDRLSGSSDNAKLKTRRQDDYRHGRKLRSGEQRMSAVRYIADYTFFTFAPGNSGWCGLLKPAEGGGRPAAPRQQ